MFDDLLLLCATPMEADGLAQRFEAAFPPAGGAPPLLRLAVTGMGMVNTASVLTRELERRRPRGVLQFGVGGAYVGSGLVVGDVAVATEEGYGEVGVLTPDGWRDAEFIGIPLVAGPPPRFNQFPLDAERAIRIAEACGATAGRFLTLSQCTGTQALADTLWDRFHAVCENMEGAAAAHVCALYGAPFLELRGISNMVENRDRSRWDFPRAIAAAQEALLATLVRFPDLFTPATSDDSQDAP